MRHDGWTGEVMARFCEVLAETGIVSTACRAVGKSRETAYANRRRNPLFDAAWQAALSIARNRLADALLARSIEGSVDYFYRDGELVGERRYIDNRLAYAMLRRLDKFSEAGLPGTVTTAKPRAAPPPPLALDWDLALTALRTRSEADLCAALTMIDAVEGNEADEADDPPDPEYETASFDEFADGRIWEEHVDEWWTNFPPPPGFAGEERGRWDDSDYMRECSSEECRLMIAAREASLADARAEEEAERDSFFADLRAELAKEDEEPGSVSSSSPACGRGLG
jgi:hypothetical protein